MRTYLTFFAFCLVPTLISQNLEVAGKVLITEMDTMNDADSVVVRAQDGTLAIRNAATFTQSFAVSPTGDTLYLTNSNWIIIPGISAANDTTTIPPGDVIITEIMTDPTEVNDTDGEWFEIYNTTAAPLDLDGWVIKDDGSNTHTINNGGPLMIGAGSYLVLGNNGDAETNGGVVVDYVYSGITMTNTTDEVILEKEGMLIDKVAYGSGGGPTAYAGASMSLDPNHLNSADNDDGTNWCAATSTYGTGNDKGTPKAVNDSCAMSAANK